MKRNIAIELKDGHKIKAVHHRPDGIDPPSDKLLVIMVNGFPKHPAHTNEFYEVLGTELEKIGFSSIRFDFTHCSDEDMQPEAFSFKTAKIDMSIIHSWAEQEGYEKFGFICEGMGAPIAFMNAFEDIKFYVLFWPITDFDYVLAKQFKITDHHEKIEEDGVFDYEGTLIGQKFLVELKDTDIVPVLESVTAPTLIFHGDRDDIVPPIHLDPIREHQKSQRIDITGFQDGEHGLENEAHRKMCLHHFREFIKKYAR